MFLVLPHKIYILLIKQESKYSRIKSLFHQTEAKKGWYKGVWLY